MKVQPSKYILRKMKKIDIACIIDDDPIFVFGTRKIMELANFCESFMVFHNGEEALNTLKPIIEAGEESMPDVILLDLNMPIMDGLEATGQIREQSNVPIIMLTAETDEEDVVMALEMGVDDYLSKPIRRRELHEAIQKHIEAKQK